MSFPRRYRGLVVVVAFALLLGLADKAFSYRLASFATNVVGDVIAEVAELTAPPAPNPQTAIAPARAVWDPARFEFPSSADNPGAYGAFPFGDQPWISLGTPLRIDLDATAAHESPGPTSASFQNPGASQRNMARQGMTGSGGPGSGGASSDEGAARLMSTAVAAIHGPQAEAAGSAITAAGLATEAVDSLETSLVAGLWPELGSGGRPSSLGGSGGELSRDPNQPGAGDIGAFGDTEYGPVSPSDLVAPGSLSEALALDSTTGGPGLDVPTVLEVSAVLDVPGAASSDLGLDWLRQLRSESALDLSPAALTGESASPADAALVISEPAMMAMFGIGLLALASRLRSKLRGKAAVQ